MNPSSSLQAAKIVGGMVRLAFHDAAEYLPKNKTHSFGPDGCVNLNNAGNAGLERIIGIVENLWKPFCEKISKAGKKKQRKKQKKKKRKKKKKKKRFLVSLCQSGDRNIQPLYRHIK